MNLDRPDVELFANLAFVWAISNYFPIGEVESTGRFVENQRMESESS